MSDIFDNHVPSAGVIKFGTWARDSILKYNEYVPTPHFNDRINTTGRMSFGDVKDILQNGNIATAKVGLVDRKEQFRVKFIWKDGVVIVGAPSTDDDGQSNGKPPYLITCYNKNDPDTEDFVLNLPLKDVIIKEVIKTVEKTGVEELSDEQLLAIVEQRKANRASAAVAERQQKIDSLTSRRDANKKNIENLYKQIEEIEEELEALNPTQKSNPHERIMLGRHMKDIERFQAAWDDRINFANCGKINVAATAKKFGFGTNPLNFHKWLTTNHPEALVKKPRI